jgi:hypothetical protein
MSLFCDGFFTQRYPNASSFLPAPHHRQALESLRLPFCVCRRGGGPYAGNSGSIGLSAEAWGGWGLGEHLTRLVGVGNSARSCLLKASLCGLTVPLTLVCVCVLPAPPGDCAFQPRGIMADAQAAANNKRCAQRACMWGFLASCVVAAAGVYCIKLYVFDSGLAGKGKGGKNSPSLQGSAPPGYSLDKSVPSLDDSRKAFQPDFCLDDYKLSWESGDDGQIYVNGVPFFMKGEPWRDVGCAIIGIGIFHTS